MRSIRNRLIEAGIQLGSSEEELVIEIMREYGKEIVDECKASAEDWDQSHVSIDEMSIEKVKQLIK